MADCVFCKIIAGEIATNKVYEDQDAIAFLDIKPVTAGHTLVVPKKHSQDMSDTDEDTLEKLISVTKKIGASVLKVTGASGFNLGVNSGEAAGQDVFHIHFHIIPRHNKNELKPWPHQKDDSETRAGLAEKIKNNL